MDRRFVFNSGLEETGGDDGYNYHIGLPLNKPAPKTAGKETVLNPSVGFLNTGGINWSQEIRRRATVALSRKRLKLKKGQAGGVSQEQYNKSVISDSEPNISQYMMEQSIPPSRTKDRDSSSPQGIKKTRFEAHDDMFKRTHSTLQELLSKKKNDRMAGWNLPQNQKLNTDLSDLKKPTMFKLSKESATPQVDTEVRLFKGLSNQTNVRQSIPLHLRSDGCFNIERGEVKELFVSTNNNDGESNTERSSALEYLQKRPSPTSKLEQISKSVDQSRLNTSQNASADGPDTLPKRLQLKSQKIALEKKLNIEPTVHMKEFKPLFASSQYPVLPPRTALDKLALRAFASSSAKGLTSVSEKTKTPNQNAKRKSTSMNQSQVQEIQQPTEAVITPILEPSQRATAKSGATADQIKTPTLSNSNSAAPLKLDIKITPNRVVAFMPLPKDLPSTTSLPTNQEETSPIKKIQSAAASQANKNLPGQKNYQKFLQYLATKPLLGAAQLTVSTRLTAWKNQFLPKSGSVPVTNKVDSGHLLLETSNSNRPVFARGKKANDQAVADNSRNGTSVSNTKPSTYQSPIIDRSRQQRMMKFNSQKSPAVSTLRFLMKKNGEAAGSQSIMDIKAKKEGEKDRKQEFYKVKARVTESKQKRQDPAAPGRMFRAMRVDRGKSKSQVFPAYFSSANKNNQTISGQSTVSRQASLDVSLSNSITTNFFNYRSRKVEEFSPLQGGGNNHSKQSPFSKNKKVPTSQSFKTLNQRLQNKSMGLVPPPKLRPPQRPTEVFLKSKKSLSKHLFLSLLLQNFMNRSSLNSSQSSINTFKSRDQKKRSIFNQTMGSTDGFGKFNRDIMSQRMDLRRTSDGGRRAHNQSQGAHYRGVESDIEGLEPHCIGVDHSSQGSIPSQRIKPILASSQDIQQQDFKIRLKASSQLFGYKPFSKKHENSDDFQLSAGVSVFNNDNDDLHSITNGSINNESCLCFVDMQSPMKPLDYVFKQTFYSAAGRSPSPKGKGFTGFSMAKKQGQPPLPAGKGIPPIKNVRITMIRQLKENDMVSKLIRYYYV